MTVRLEAPLGELVQKLADNDDRSIGYVLRQLILEAMQARKLLPGKKAKLVTGKKKQRSQEYEAIDVPEDVDVVIDGQAIEGKGVLFVPKAQKRK